MIVTIPIFMMVLAGAALAAWPLYSTLVARIVVREFEVALLYFKGRYVATLTPGLYRKLRPWTSWQLVDRRLSMTTVPGQEILTSDNVGLKASLLLAYEIDDAARAIHTVESYADFLYAQAQIAVRDVLAARGAEKLVAGRVEMNAALLEAIAPAAAAMGIKVLRAEIKDMMFAGEMKTLFASVVRARHEALAALERARGETAAMRSLMNAAALMESHPALTGLKWLQTLDRLGNGSGNTVVMGVPGDMLPWKEVKK